MPPVEWLFGRPELRDAIDFDITLVGEPAAFSVNATVHGISQFISSPEQPRIWKPIATEVMAEAASGRILGVTAGAPLLGVPFEGLIGGTLGGLAAYWSAIRRQNVTAPVALESVIEDVKRMRGLDVQVREVATHDSPVAAILGVYGTGTAVITVDANLSADWKRFVIAKELAHLIVAPDGQAEATTPFELRELLRHLAVDESPAQRHEVVQRQTVDYLLALEILFPQALRTPAFRSVAEGRLSMEELSRGLIVPPPLVATARALTINPANDASEMETALLWPSLLVSSPQPSTLRPDGDAGTAGAIQRLLEQGGGAISLSEIGGRLGKNLDETRTLIAGGDVFAIRGPDSLLAPADQFLPNKSVVPGLKAVLTQFIDRHPVITLQFLVTPDSTLNGLSPLRALAHGEPWTDAVERLARAHQGDGFA